jgi:hypothetical protein
MCASIYIYIYTKIALSQNTKYTRKLNRLRSYTSENAPFIHSTLRVGASMEDMHTMLNEYYKDLGPSSQRNKIKIMHEGKIACHPLVLLLWRCCNGQSIAFDENLPFVTYLSGRGLTLSSTTFHGMHSDYLDDIYIYIVLTYITIYKYIHDIL